MIKDNKHNTIPVINLDKLELSNNYYLCNGNTYDVPNLIQFCKDKGYKEFDLPLVGINIDVEPFSIRDVYSFCWHMNRVNDADLKYPVILDDKGFICDGWHRVCKAILNGNKTIKAIRMLDMPRSSGKSDAA
jgi:hypothetical protein